MLRSSAAGNADCLTRAEAAEIMRVSIATVRRLQERELHPERSADRFYLSDRREVEIARARCPPPLEPRDCRDSGELTAEAFKSLCDSVDIRDLVIALRGRAGKIASIHAEWSRIRNAFVISEADHSQLSRMVRHSILAGLLRAIEEDDSSALCELISDAVNAKFDERRDLIQGERRCAD